MVGAINLREKLALFDEHWKPKIVADVNDYHVKIAKIEGEFVRHRHEETDELFLVLKGELTIETESGSVRLREGDLYVVPRGVEHRPIAEQEAHILMIEPGGTVNTGDVGGELTAQDERI
jgi:mannose-6-phosphate isomerase-like protein (cupin superfamily)